MKVHLRDIPYLIKHDLYFRKKFIKLIFVGSISLVVISGFLIVAGYFLYNPVVELFLSTLPVVTEFLFNNARGYLSSYMKEDILNTLNSLTSNTNVTTLKGMIIKYFDRLSTNSNADFQSFLNFISSVKNVLSDGNVAGNELEIIRKLLTSK